MVSQRSGRKARERDSGAGGLAQTPEITAERPSYNGPNAEVRAEIDPKTGEIHFSRLLLVVDEIDNDSTQITLNDAQKKDPSARIGDWIAVALPPFDYVRAEEVSGREFGEEDRKAKRASLKHRSASTKARAATTDTKYLAPDEARMLEASRQFVWELLDEWAKDRLGAPGAHLADIRRRLAGV